MLKQIYKNIKSKISQKLEPIRQNYVHFRTQHPRFTLKTIQHLLPFEKKFFLLACIIVDNISSATNTNNKNQLKHNKSDCAVFKSSIKNFKCF